MLILLECTELLRVTGTILNPPPQAPSQINCFVLINWVFLIHMTCWKEVKFACCMDLTVKNKQH